MQLRSTKIEMRVAGSSRRRQRVSLHSLLIASAIFTGVSLLILTIRSIDPSDSNLDRPSISDQIEETVRATNSSSNIEERNKNKACATVEEMGEELRGAFWEDSIRVRNIIRRHFDLYGVIFFFFLILINHFYEFIYFYKFMYFYA